jgi:transcriptional regulator with GAF, ATPase, and Fis domain
MTAFGSTCHAECECLDHLVTEASSALLRVTGQTIRVTVTTLLQRIAEAIDVDRVTFIQSSERSDSVEAAYVWARQPRAATEVASDASRFTKLLEGLVFDGSPVASVDIPDTVCVELFPAVSSALAIPVAVGACCRNVLVVEAIHTARAWPVSVIQRLRLLTEMLAAAVHRLAQERALHGSRIEAARLVSALATEAEPSSPPACAFDDIIGSSTPLRAALRRVQQVAMTDSTVLLLGETGTGKELFARAIHANSLRRGRPLVTLNCAALPAALVESELFGHQRGAFTGAVSERVGRFELAHRSTLFLDEIGDLPLEIQSKLLRVLQDRTFERLGSSQTRRMDVRIIAATHQNLAGAVAEGRFRADLYYRLSVFPIQLPPLRDRPEDIPTLVWAIIRKRQQAIGRAISQVASNVMQRLQAYRWPGNVRELENVVERALINSTGEAIAQLDDEFTGDAPQARSDATTATTLVSVERTYIERVLHDCEWRINGSGNAAERLGLHPNTLRFRMKKLGIVRRGSTSTSPPIQPAADPPNRAPMLVRSR